MRRFTIRWDVAMGCYRVSEPNVTEPLEVVAAAAYDDLREALTLIVGADPQGAHAIAREALDG